MKSISIKKFLKSILLLEEKILSKHRNGSKSEFNTITNKNSKVLNSNLIEIFDHLCKILFIGGSGSGKKHIT